MQIGVLGTGQLCLMLANAAKSLDVAIKPCGEQENLLLNVLCEPAYISFDDVEHLLTVLKQVDVITFETESIPEQVMLALEENAQLANKCRPNLRALRTFQNRLREKDYFAALNLATAKYHAVLNTADLDTAAALLGFPFIIKTTTGGYDGKGQVLIKTAEELSQAWDAVGQRPCIAEQFVPFDGEVSIIGARDVHGHSVFYPLIKNYHRDGILRLSLVDAQPHVHQAAAESVMQSIMQDLNYIGCMTLEFFVHNNQLLLNEVAPRVHNSGHWTLDASDSSQFLLHLQAVSGATIRPPKLDLPVAMLNCIGEIPQHVKDIMSPTVKLYNYGKEPRANRKLGHINFLASNFGSEFNQRIVEYLHNENDETLLEYFRK